MPRSTFAYVCADILERNDVVVADVIICTVVKTTLSHWKMPLLCRFLMKQILDEKLFLDPFSFR